MSLAFRKLESHRSWLNQTAENSARTTRSALLFETNGHGELVTPELEFGITFLERPLVTSGVELKEGWLIEGSFPNTDVGVFKWGRTPRGYYVSVRLFIVVESPGAVGYPLLHHVVLEGMAFKTLAE